MQQAVAKTISFRVIVTTLDFTSNYLVIGELGAAAGLSAFSLVVGPVFYFVHETGWNYLSRSIERPAGASETAVQVPISFLLRQNGKGRLARGGGFTMSRALAKTITFRIFATTMDFATNFVVVGDVAAAATLSAFGFVLGPFIYFGHEKAWEYYSSRRTAPPSRGMTASREPLAVAAGPLERP